MKRAAILLLVSIASIGATWAAFQVLAPGAPPLSGYFPAGSLLYLQAKDFSVLVADWNASPQKASWVKSKNYEVYSRSRLFLRLQGAGQQFAAAASLPPDMNFLTQVAGTQSALALYDIGKLELRYETAFGQLDAIRALADAREIRDTQRRWCHLLRSARSRVRARGDLRHQRRLFDSRHTRGSPRRRAPTHDRQQRTQHRS